MNISETTLGVVFTGVAAVAAAAAVVWPMWKHFSNKPLVRLRAAFVPSMGIPIVLFRLVNVRKDEVHIHPLMGHIRSKGKDTHFLVPTRPSHGISSFRLGKLESASFEVQAHNAFPDECAPSEIKGFYVEDVTTGHRWKLPRRNLRKVRNDARKYLECRREIVLWKLTCRVCEETVCWQDKRPEPTSVGYSYGLPCGTLQGWTQDDLTNRLPLTQGLALCPGCSAQAASAQASGAHA